MNGVSPDAVRVLDVRHGVWVMQQYRILLRGLTGFRVLPGVISCI